jgi:molybdopterin-containing oxidoreductase family membrane subunit
MDSALIPRGVKRCSIGKFTLWNGLVGIVLLWGVFAMLLVWLKGLNQTNMNNAYGFALWIWADLAVIALGGGAFFTGFLRYIIGKDELKNIINYAVLIGFICYSAALLILAIDIGQPLRGWYIFWHANVHSMLTEVAFCISAYFAVLAIEYLPLVLENRQIDKVPFFHNLSHNMHEVGGVCRNRRVPVVFPPGFSGRRARCTICATLWFSGRRFHLALDLLFVYLVGGGGGSLLYDTCYKNYRSYNVIELLAKISGWMLLTYSIAKIIDTWYWATTTVPSKGFTLWDFYTNNPLYGIWILILEVGVGGVLPAVILVTQKGRKSNVSLWVAVILASIGVCVNRWVMVLQVLAVPVLPFTGWNMYVPSWQEVATTILPVAYGIILIMLSYRYLPIFPQEQELNPIEPPAPQEPVAVSDTEAQSADTQKTELKPAQA